MKNIDFVEFCRMVSACGDDVSVFPQQMSGEDDSHWMTIAVKDGERYVGVAMFGVRPVESALEMTLRCFEDDTGELQAAQAEVEREAPAS